MPLIRLSLKLLLTNQSVATCLISSAQYSNSAEAWVVRKGTSVSSTSRISPFRPYCCTISGVSIKIEPSKFRSGCKREPQDINRNQITLFIAVAEESWRELAFEHPVPLPVHPESVLEQPHALPKSD